MFKGFREFITWEQTTQDTVDFKKVYVDISKDLVSGLLLSQIVYWYLPNKEGKSKLRVKRDGHFWIAKKRSDWYDEIRLSEQNYKTAIKKLENLNLVEKKRFKFDGSPTTHIRLNIPVFLKLLGEILEEKKEALSDDFDDYLEGQISEENTSEALGGLDSVKSTETKRLNQPNGNGEINRNLNRENLKDYPKKITNNLSIVNELKEYEFVHSRLEKMDRLTDYKLNIVVKVAKRFIDLFPYDDTIKNQKAFITVLERCLDTKTKKSFEKLLSASLENEIKELELGLSNKEKPHTEDKKPVRQELKPKWLNKEQTEDNSQTEQTKSSTDILIDLFKQETGETEAKGMVFFEWTDNKCKEYGVKISDCGYDGLVSAINQLS